MMIMIEISICSSCVLDERHLLAAVRYVENNPVAVGLVKRPWEYSWSSAAYHVGIVMDDALVKNKDLFGIVKDWRAYLLNESSDTDAFHNVRKATKTGWPAGDDDFVIRIEKLTGRLLRRKKPGPKKK